MPQQLSAAVGVDADADVGGDEATARRIFRHMELTRESGRPPSIGRARKLARAGSPCRGHRWFLRIRLV